MIIWIISADWLSDMKSWQFSVCHDKDCLASMCTLLELNIQVKAWAQSWLNIFIGLIGLKPCLRVFFRWTMCKGLASGKQCLWPLLRATAVPINKAVSARQQPGGNEQLCSTTSFPKSAKNNLCPVQRKTDRERESLRALFTLTRAYKETGNICWWIQMCTKVVCSSPIYFRWMC